MDILRAGVRMCKQLQLIPTKSQGKRTGYKPAKTSRNGDESKNKEYKQKTLE